MAEFSKRFFLCFFLIILIGCFLFLPKIGFSEEDLEKIIDDPGKIELKEEEGKLLFFSLLQKLSDKWEEVVIYERNFSIEEETVLIITKKAIQKELFNYLLIQNSKEAGKEIIKIGFKILQMWWRSGFSIDLKEILDEFERLTVDKAKKYAVEWLLQNDMRVAVGNLPISYYSINANLQDIILYKPIDPLHAYVGINIYSPKPIKIPHPMVGFQWEGGIEELPPFIVEINGQVEKLDNGAYFWVKGPEINIIFNEPVPEFDFKEPGFFDKLRDSFNETKAALERAGQKIGDLTDEVTEVAKNTTKIILDKLKSIISNFNVFRATVAPQLLPLGESEIDVSEINFENLIPKEQIVPLIEEITEEQKGLKETVRQIETISKPKLTLEEIQEILDDITEKVDIISQKTSELMSTYQQAVEELAPGEEPEKDLEGKLEEEEETDKGEQEEKRGEEPAPEFCKIVSGAMPARNKVIFNEIAWMGTSVFYNNEWLELKNISGNQINLSGWQILSGDQKIKIVFIEGEVLLVNDYYILERSSDETIPNLKADKIYNGALNNENESLYLFDESCQLQDEISANPDWPAGDNNTKRTMERKTDLTWQTSLNPDGTPRAENSSGYILISGGGGGGSNPSVPPIYPKILITEIQIAGMEDKKEEFVELYNPNDQDVSLTDWYIQRKTKTAESFSTFVSSNVLSGKVIEAKDYFLVVRENSNLVNLADVMTTYPLAEDNTLVFKNPNQEIVDKVGWGESQDFETAPADNPPGGKSISRQWNLQNQEYQDSDNNSVDFGIQEPTPKTVNTQPVSPPPPQPGTLIDNMPPQVVFNLELIQTSLSFIIGWEITDSALETVTPSGLDGFIFRWKEKNDASWQEDEYQQIEGAPLLYTGEKIFLGEDEKTYYFQIKAKDSAGNESDWLQEPPIFTKISIPKIVLINEIQIDSKEGKGGTDDDWVELYNPNDFDISLKGWSIQKHSPDEPCSIDKSFYKKNFSEEAIIPAKSFFLIVDTQAQGWLKSLADMTIGWSLTDNSTIYLAKKEDEIESGQDLDIVDKVGFGQSCFPENTSAPNPPEGKSIERKEVGVDTDDNSQDFEVNDNSTPTNSRGETFSLPSFGESPWPMYQGNPQRNGSSKYIGPQNAPSLLWQYDEESDLDNSSNNPVYNPSVIGRDGTVYSAVSYPLSKAGIVAINYNGARKWFREESLNSALLVLGVDDSVSQDNNAAKAEGRDGTIYYGEGPFLYAFDKEGNKKWEREFEFENPNQYPYGNLEPGVVAPAVGEDGTVYAVVQRKTCNSLGEPEDFLYAMSGQNEVLWQVNLGGYASSMPAASSDGTVYIFNLFFGKYAAGPDLFLRAVGPEGIEWSKNLGWANFHSLPIVDSVGNIYFSIGSFAYCYNSNGEEVWQFHLMGPAEWYISDGGVAISGDGTIYFVGRGVIFALK